MEAVYKILMYFTHLPGIVIAFTLHEYVKATASNALGDSTPKREGRLTLNPAKHFEPIGFLCLFFFGMGWGKPTETKSFGYKNRRRDELIVYTVPSLINIIIGILFAVAAKSVAVWMPAEAMAQSYGHLLMYSILLYVGRINLMYAFFNILPVYPLDGARILSTLKPDTGMWLKANERMCQLVLMLALCFGILGQVLGGAADGLMGFAYNGAI